MDFYFESCVFMTEVSVLCRIRNKFGAVKLNFCLL